MDNLAVGVKNPQEFDDLCSAARERIAAGEECIVSILPRPSFEGNTTWLREAVADARKEMGFSQKKLASMIGVSIEYLSDFETGKSCPGAWKEILDMVGIRLVRPSKPNYEYYLSAEKGYFGKIAREAREDLGIRTVDIARDCKIVQTRYLAFEKGKEELSFAETESVLTFLGFRLR